MSVSSPVALSSRFDFPDLDFLCMYPIPTIVAYTLGESVVLVAARSSRRRRRMHGSLEHYSDILSQHSPDYITHPPVLVPHPPSERCSSVFPVMLNASLMLTTCVK